MTRDMKKELLEITGGEFLDWYKKLTPSEKCEYKKAINKLKKKYYEKGRQIN